MKYRLNEKQLEAVQKVFFLKTPTFIIDGKETVMEGEFTEKEQKKIERIIEKYRVKQPPTGWRGVPNPKKYASEEEYPSRINFKTFSIRLKKELFEKSRKKFGKNLTFAISSFLEEQTKNIIL